MSRRGPKPVDPRFPDMRLRNLLCLTVAGLLAAGCAHKDRVYMGGDLGWSLNSVDGEGLKLAYGQFETDSVLLMMTCQPRSGEVLVSVNTVASAKPLLQVSSGGRTARYPAQIGPNLGDGAVVEAMATTADPVLASFARTGDLTVAAGGKRNMLAGGAAEARRFMDGCRA